MGEGNFLSLARLPFRHARGHPYHDFPRWRCKTQIDPIDRSGDEVVPASPLLSFDYRQVCLQCRGKSFAVEIRDGLSQLKQQVQFGIAVPVGSTFLQVIAQSIQCQDQSLGAARLQFVGSSR